MKSIITASLALILAASSYAQVCNNVGNLIIFSNYDGSQATTTARLNIVIDQNIPNIKIGICSYERVTVNITGAFVGNVTAVRYAGFNAMGNCNCGVTAGCANTSVITGVPAGIITYSVYPPVTVSDPNGTTNMTCAYQCTSGNQGGCNTASQVVAYFSSVLGGTFRSHTVQYGCWNGASFNFSSAGNCCLTTALPVELSQFEVQLTENKRSHLTWTTESEINNDYFIAERSIDLEHWQLVDSVDGKGTSTIQHSYETWDDELNEPNIIYYRIKSLDFDGTEHFSEIRSIHLLADANELTVYPNPVSETIFITSDADFEEYLNVELLDATGKVVKKAIINSRNGEGLAVSDITNGFYILIVSSDKKEARRSTKIMIHNN